MDDLTPAAGWPAPDDTVTDYDRQAMVERIQQALADDHIEFSEIDERFGLVFGAKTKADLAKSVEGLPVPPQPPPPQDIRHFAPENSFSLLGDVQIGGWVAVGRSLSATSIIGDVLIDVSSAMIGDDGLDIIARSIIGDVKIVLPDGARVQSSVVNLIGARKEILVAPVPGGPTIRISAFGLLGDTKIYSLSAVPEGKLRKAWAALRRAVDGRPPNSN